MTNTVQTLDQTLTELIQTTVAAAEKGAEFVATEAPIVVEQLLRWHFVENLVWFLVGALGVAAVICWARCFWKNYLKDEGGWDQYDCECFLATFGGVIAPVVVLVLSAIALNTTWLKIWIAPKLYLLEYAAELIK